MATIDRGLNSHTKGKQQRLRVSVLLPDCYCRGNVHADVDFAAKVEGDKLLLSLVVDGEDFERVHSHYIELTWEDLHVISHK